MRLWMCGFEQGHIGVFDSVTGSVSTTQARTGTYSFLSSSTSYGRKELDTAISELYMRVAVYPTATVGSTGCSNIAHFLDSAGAAQFTIGINPSNRKIQARRGAYSGTLVAESDDSVPLNAWRCYEIWYKPHDTTGEIEVKCNGVLVIDFSGDTQNTGNANVKHVGVGSYAHSLHYVTAYTDDVVINDTSGAQNNSWPGRGGIYPVYPDSAGQYTQWTPSAGNNWDCVDEVPPSDADYVEDNVAAQKDTYNLDALPEAGTIQAVCWWARAKISAGGSGSFRKLYYINASDYTGGDETLSETWEYYFDVDELNPDDSAAWEKADIDALQAGAEVRT